MKLKVFDLRCPRCGDEQGNVLVDEDAEMPTCERCGRSAMSKVPALVRTFTVGPGRSEESRATHKAKLKTTLEKRSRDYDLTPRGRAEREEAIHRMQKRGYPFSF